MSLISFRRGRDQAGRWRDGRLQEQEPLPPPPEPSPDAGTEARSFYESLIAEGQPQRPPSPPEPPHFCRTCGASFRDPPERHLRSTGHLLGLGAPPEPPPEPPPAGPGLRLLLRAGWSGGGLGPGGRGRLLPVPTRLKRDRGGLGWGPRPRARVSHFGPGDVAAVAGPPRAGTGEKRDGNGNGRRQRRRSEAAERAWEIRLREYMERWDPPEPPGAPRDPRAF